jgi:hypothetical protein
VTANLARWALAVALTLATSTLAMRDATASEAADAARKWGLIGTWAVDCSVPPDKASPLIICAIGSGDRVLLRRDYGNRIDEQEVGSVEIAADGNLLMRTSFPSLKQIRESAIAMAPDGSIRAIYNRNEKDEYTVRDGIYVANGSPAIALHRCAPKTG